jgi:hypothetical protein
MMETNSAYENIVTKHGWPLASAGVNGVAFERRFALEAIDALRNMPFAILGGDVYRAGGDGVHLTYDNWYAQRMQDEGFKEFQERSLATASNYISNYREPADGTTLYSLVLNPRS